MSAFIERVVHAVRDAGRVIQQVRNEGFETELKGDQSPVTRADRAADALLKERLLALEDCGWLSEESADDKRRLDLRRLWVVDPLDGTKEFIKGIPEYSVAVALVEDGRPLLGVVHNPVTGETWHAERGVGAWAGDDPLEVVEGQSLLASNSEMKRGEFARFEADWKLTSVGSIEYKLGRVAAGTAGATLSRGPKWEWDVCAGHVLVAEAGGLATDVFGEPLTYNKDFCKVRGILAGAPDTHRTACDQVRALGASDRMSEFADAPIENAPGNPPSSRDS